MTGLFVVLGCTIIFFLLAQILTPSSTYNPNNDSRISSKSRFKSISML